MRRSELFEQFEREFADDPECLTDGLLLRVTEIIYVAMEDQGLSRRELAERADVSPRSLTEFFNASTNTSLLTIVRFAQALGLEVEIALRPKQAAAARATRAAKSGDKAAQAA